MIVTIFTYREENRASLSTLHCSGSFSFILIDSFPGVAHTLQADMDRLEEFYTKAKERT